MNLFNNQYQGRDLKEYYRNFYYQNKLIVYMMAASLVLLAISKTNIFDIFYYVYLIYFGGYIIKQYLGEKKALNTFLISGLAGFILFAIIAPGLLLSIYVLPVIVASASLGLLAAAATYVPNLEVMLVLVGKVKIKWLALILIGIDLLHVFNGSVFSISHLGGISYGALSIYLLRGSKLQFDNPFKNLFKRKGVYYKKPKNTTSYTRPESDEDYLTRKNKEQAEIDAILEKVKKNGYESLSSIEKQKLFNKSNNG